MYNMEFFFENVNMISNRRGVNCNAKQRNFITINFLDEKKGGLLYTWFYWAKVDIIKKGKQT